MPTQNKVTAHLPYLRRFARALTGSQSGGDAYVAAALEAAIADPSALDPALDTRIALYRLFLDIWNTVPLNTKAAKPQSSTLDQAGADRQLEMLTPKPR